MLAPFPRADGSKRDLVAESDMERLMQVVTAIRTLRATYEVERRKKIKATVASRSVDDRGLVTSQAALVRALAGLESLSVVESAPAVKGAIRQSLVGFELVIPMTGLFEIEAERARLSKELGKLDAEMAGLNKKLDNPQFVERAKPEVVAESRQRGAELLARRSKIEATLAQLAEA